MGRLAAEEASNGRTGTSAVHIFAPSHGWGLLEQPPPGVLPGGLSLTPEEEETLGCRSGLKPHEISLAKS